MRYFEEKQTVLFNNEGVTKLQTSANKISFIPPNSQGKGQNKLGHECLSASTRIRDTLINMLQVTKAYTLYF